MLPESDRIVTTVCIFILTIYKCTLFIILYGVKYILFHCSVHICSTNVAIKIIKKKVGNILWCMPFCFITKHFTK